MSGSALVQAFRAAARRPDTSPPRKKPFGQRWRQWIFLGCGIVCCAGFGGILARAGDDSGVYDIARQYTTARGGPRFHLPQIFQPERPPGRASAYAPVYGAAAGDPLALPATGKRALDALRRNDRTRMAASGSKSLRNKDRKSFETAYLTRRTSYCVRSCDGFFFPLGNPDAGGLAAHEAACARACPAAETAVYVANAGTLGIDDAVNRKGLRYQATRTAFNHRTQVDSACTCNGAPGAARNHSVMNDFTLRSGDLVMTAEGLRVFRGSESLPHRPRHFARAETASLSPAERKWMQSSEAASMRGTPGAAVSETLQARIEAQVKASRAYPPVSGPGLRGVERTISVSDGRRMRYVGPDVASVQR